MTQPQDPVDDQHTEAVGGAAPETEPAPEAGPTPEAEPNVEAAPDAEAGPNADLKARYRDALAHKHGSSGAHKETHGDAGAAAHSQSTGPTQKMFRRKAGG